VVDLAIGLAGTSLAVALDTRWPMYPSVALIGATTIVLPGWAMIREIRRQRGTGGRPNELRDTVLGVLTRVDDDPTMWESAIEAQVGTIFVRICGAGVPDPALLMSAGKIRQNLSTFERRIADFKEWVIKAEPPMCRFTDEIRALQVETICFFDPSLPNEADVFYSGGRDGRCWHGGLVDGFPQGLSFDT